MMNYINFIIWDLLTVMSAGRRNRKRTRVCERVESLPSCSAVAGLSLTTEEQKLETDNCLFVGNMSVYALHLHYGY